MQSPSPGAAGPFAETSTGPFDHVLFIHVLAPKLTLYAPLTSYLHHLPAPLICASHLHLHELPYLLVCHLSHLTFCSIDFSLVYLLPRLPTHLFAYSVICLLACLPTRSFAFLLVCQPTLLPSPATLSTESSERNSLHMYEWIIDRRCTLDLARDL